MPRTAPPRTTDVPPCRRTVHPWFAFEEFDGEALAALVDGAGVDRLRLAQIVIEVDARDRVVKIRADGAGRRQGAVARR